MQKAVIIAATLHGGMRDIQWVLDADPEAVDIVFLACQRKLTAESLGNIPSKEQPTYEELEGYMQLTQSEPNLAWGDRYPQLCMWMADYENRRREKERSERESAPGFGTESIMNGKFDYQR